MFFSRKASIQLSMNFFVTIIIAIVLLGMGIALLNKFVGITVDTQQQLDGRTQERINELLAEGKQVAIPFNKQTVSRGESVLFGVGVLNILAEGSFTIEIDLSAAYKPDRTEFDRADVDVIRQQIGDWVLYDTIGTTIPSNERRTFNVLVDVPKAAQSGEYIFNLQVLADGQPYDTIQKIYVKVP